MKSATKRLAEHLARPDAGPLGDVAGEGAPGGLGGLPGVGLQTPPASLWLGPPPALTPLLPPLLPRPLPLSRPLLPPPLLRLLVLILSHRFVDKVLQIYYSPMFEMHHY